MSQATRKRQDAERRGHRAERRAILSYAMRGFRVLARRYRTNLGEIDFIAARGDVLAFVEVKARETKTEGIDAVTYRARRRIEGAARQFLAREARLIGRPPDVFAIRYDIIVVGSNILRDVWHETDAWREGE